MILDLIYIEDGDSSWTIQELLEFWQISSSTSQQVASRVHVYVEGDSSSVIEPLINLETPPGWKWDILELSKIEKLLARSSAGDSIQLHD